MRSLRSRQDTVTLIAVPPKRLQDEYNLGRSDQQHDEHYRKQLRISLGIGSTLLVIVSAAAGFQTTPLLLASLLFQCTLHVIL